jgi:hypothetical protein
MDQRKLGACEVPSLPRRVALGPSTGLIVPSDRVVVQRPGSRGNVRLAGLRFANVGRRGHHASIVSKEICVVTTVGTETSLPKLLHNLIELDYDAIEAYRAAINRLDDPECERMMGAFMADHQRYM